MTKLSAEEVKSRLQPLSGWELSENAITKSFTFQSFMDAIAFVNRVAEVAERADHHPDILIYNYRRVKMTLSTHSEGGITEKDFNLARQIDQVVSS